MFSIQRNDVTAPESLEFLHMRANEVRDRLEELRDMLLAWRETVEGLDAAWRDAAGRSVMERDVMPVTDMREKIRVDMTDITTVNDAAGTALMETWAEYCRAGRTIRTIDQTGDRLLDRLPSVRHEISTVQAHLRDSMTQTFQAETQIPSYT
ncbi:hypothetical protein [Novacetimonas hansenii]|uniref:hypothetical protein n=1 Tax=Novacetimonas hansenii TaxID=436 RepID=UPI00094F8896|nr:hypothetical protein [Novacetimonas hansenii]PYD73404.1 hypothetical protein CFR74_04595 [Novacetimonas hansenii]